MTISEHATTFGGLPVIDVDTERGLTEPPHRTAWRVRAADDAWDDDLNTALLPRLDEFAALPGADQVEALVVGSWGRGYDNPSGPLVDWLVAHADRLAGLRSLFLGDITFEENEISWIEQSNVTPILDAFPQLVQFRVRGGTGLTLGPVDHTKLEQLVVESGGLDGGVTSSIAESNLPALRHLELWLGDSGYGASTTPTELAPILGGRFPLRYLGLRDSEIADDLASALASAPVVPGLAVLDLSLGTFGDAGAEALASGQPLEHLELLDLHHHYLTGAGIARLEDLGVRLDLSDQQVEDEYGRYVAVAE